MHESVTRVPESAGNAHSVRRAPTRPPVGTSSTTRSSADAGSLAAEHGASPAVRSGPAGRIQRRQPDVDRPPAGPDGFTALEPSLVAAASDVAGTDLSDVSVRYGSAEPATFGAHALTRGSQIHIGPGQEQHLAHEAWHVVQQRRGRVAATAVSAHGLSNRNVGLERDADAGGARLQSRALAVTAAGRIQPRAGAVPRAGPADPEAVTQFVEVFGKAPGPGRMRVLWDSEWSEDRKLAEFEKLTAAECAVIMSKTTQMAKDFEAWVEKGRPPADKELGLPTPGEPISVVDAQWFARLTEKGLTAQQQPQANAQPQQTPKMPVPKSETKGQAPHKKTPDGVTGKLQVNYSVSSSGGQQGEQLEHMRFFGEVARKLGLVLRVVARETAWTDLKMRKVLEGVKVELVLANYDTSEWAEDANEYLEPHTRATLAKFTKRLLSEGMLSGRRARWLQLGVPENVTNSDVDHQIPTGTLVNDAALAGGMEPTGARPSIRAYLEGGNMISGEDSDGKPLILIGKDAFAATAFAYGISEAEVRLLIAEDFGLDPTSILPVEQPGAFHLDMGLLFLGRGMVIVNSSRPLLASVQDASASASASATKALPPLSAIEAICKLEDAAALQLQEAGLKVHREFLACAEFNFLNGEFVSAADGSRHFLTNGSADAALQDRFALLMTKELQIVDQVWFSPPESALKSLTDKGGVGCRMKGLPSGM